MKAVLFVIATLMAVNIYAQNCYVPEYETTIQPVECQPKYPLLNLPNYQNVSTYYSCSTKKPVLKDCDSDTYFSYVLQQCSNCNDYIPTVRCNSLKINVTCQPINATESTTSEPTTVTTTSTTVTTTSSSTSTSTSTSTTAADPVTKTTTTTTTTPHPPTASDTTSTTASGDSGVVTPSGTTLDIPGPPSPGNSDVPSPQTPNPTAPVIDNQPPTPSPTTT